MTREELEAIEKRAEAATTGPWRCDARVPDDVVIWGQREPGNPEHRDGNFLGNVGSSRIGEVGVAFDMDAKNGEFIAAARADVPSLLAEVRRLQEVEEAARAFRALAVICVDMQNDDERWPAIDARLAAALGAP